MNIQIFGKTKCFDTKKAERYFKERGIKFQSIDVASKGMSKGEFNSVKQAVGGFEKLIDEKSNSDVATLIKYLCDEKSKEEKLLENTSLFKTPIVRKEKQENIEYCTDIWENWE